MAKFGSLEHLKSWIGTKSANEAFPAAAGCNCLFCQYGEANGVGPAGDISTYGKTIALVDLSDDERESIVGGDRTFGLAFDRAAALQERLAV